MKLCTQQQKGKYMYTVNSITLPMLTSYLQHQKWQKLDVDLDLPITVWKNANFPTVTLRVPKNDSLSDYMQAINQVIKTLADTEQRTTKEILTSLNNQDTISIRVISNDVKNGTIPLNDGTLLFQSAESMIKSAASKIFSSIKKGTSKRQQIKEFMDSVLLGQTQVGSYAINIITPKTTHDTNQQDIAPVPTGKMINDTLYQALSSLKSSVETYKREDNILEFARASANGADARICHAIIQMSGTNKERDVEIKLIGEDPIQLKSDRSIYFSAQDIEPVEKAYNYLTGRDFVIKGGHYIGQIVALKKEPDSNSGKVTINTFVQEKPKKVSFILYGKDYEQAIDAHKLSHETYVQCVGDIHCTKTSAELSNVTSFSLIKQPTL